MLDAAPPKPGAVTASGLRLSTVWAFAAFALPLTVVLAGRMLAVDLAYVVQAGRIMLRTGEILRTDPFLFTTGCGPWLNQQWGAELLLAGAFDALGWFGLVVARAALTASIVAFVYAACRRHGAGRRAAGWLTLLGAVLLLGGLQLRAQLFGLALFAALLWILSRRVERPNDVFLAVPVLLVWANVHGSFPFGVLLLLLAWADDRMASRRHGRTLAAALLGLAMTVVTPFGASAWGYVVELSTNPVMRSVVDEWQPPWRTPSTGVVLLLSFVLAGVVVWRNRRTLPLPALVQVGLFAIFAATSTRAVYWWGIVLPVTLARLPWAGREPAADPRNRTNRVLAGAFAAIPLVALLRWAPYAGDEPPADRLRLAPVALTEELRSVLRPGEPFKNPQRWGSWFEFGLSGHPVFVDSRFEVMPLESLRVNHTIADAKPGWEGELDALRVRVLVVDREWEPSLVEALAGSTVWRAVYGDAEGLIYVRDGRGPVEPLAPCEETPG